jgi:hypothetical protein
VDFPEKNSAQNLLKMESHPTTPQIYTQISKTFKNNHFAHNMIQKLQPTATIPRHFRLDFDPLF